MIYFVVNPYDFTWNEIESKYPDMIRYPEDWPDIDDDYDFGNPKKIKYMPKAWVCNTKEEAIVKVKMLLENNKKNILDYMSELEGRLHTVQTKLDNLNVLHTPIQS